MFNLHIKQSLLILSIAVVLTGCSKSEAPQSEAVNKEDTKKELILGFSVGNYYDQFKYGVLPILEKQGYTITLKQFSQGAREINPATAKGDIDGGVVQTPAYLEASNKQNNTNIIPIAVNPSPPQTLRSKKHHSLDDVKDGMIVILSNDPINEERGARLLEELGWIKIKSTANPFTFNVNDIEPGKYHLTIKEAEGAQGLRLLDDADFAVVNGNYVAGAGLKIRDGLYIEKTPLRHRVVLTIDAKNENTQWAKDLKTAFESKEFADYIRSQPVYEDYIEPEAWQKYPK